MAAEARGRLVLDTVYNASGLDQAAASIKAMEGGISSLGNKLSIVTLGLSGMITSKVLGAISDAATHFDQLTKATASFTGDIEALKRATSGTVDELELMTAHNRMMLEGVKLSGEGMEELFANTKRVSTAMGRDFAEGISAVEMALLGQTKALKSNLGIVIDEKKAYADLADALKTKVEWLTNDEKAQARLEAVSGELAKRSNAVAGSVDTAGDSIKRLKNNIENATEAVLEFVYKGIGEFKRSMEIMSHSGSLEDAMFGKGDDEIRRSVEAGYGEKGLETSSAFYQSGASVTGELGRGGGVFDALSAGTAAMSKQLRGADQLIKQARSQGFGKGGREGEAQAAAIAFMEKRITWEQFVRIAKETGPGAKRGGKGARRDSSGYSPSGEGWEENEFGLAGIHIRKPDAQMLAGMSGWMSEAADKIAQDRLEQQIKAWGHLKTAQQEALEITKEMHAELRSSGVSALAEYAGGIWAAADAAIQGGESFGKALLDMTKQTLLGIAQQATVKAVFEVAEGFAALAATWGIPNPKSTAHFTAAGIYGTIAAISGGLGLGMSAATAGSTSSSNKSSFGGTGSADNRFKPAWGERSRKEEQQQIIVKVVFDRSDPASEMYARRKVTATRQAA